MAKKEKAQSRPTQHTTQTDQEVQEVAAQLRHEQPLLSFEEAADAHVRRNKDALVELAKW